MTRGDSPNDRIVYRYDRGKRLEKASPDVRRFADMRASGTSGYFRSLLSNRPLMTLFFTLVIAAIFVNLAQVIYGDGSTVSLGGRSWKASAFMYDGKIYVTLRSTRTGTEGSAAGALSIMLEKTGTLVYEGIFGPGEREEHRFILPPDAIGGDAKVPSLALMVTIPDGSGKLLVKVSGGSGP